MSSASAKHRMTYYEFEIASSETNLDVIYNRLYLNGVKSILEENGVLKFYIQENEILTAGKIIQELIEQDGIGSKNIILCEFKDQNWNKKWERTIKPVRIAGKIIIYPSWKKKQLGRTKGKILIQIDPKMSFGTGHNETTQLVLKLMCNHIDEKDKLLLDFGCGTGILAIAAVKLGVKKAIAIDIDNEAIVNAKENIRINKTEHNITLRNSTIKDVKRSGFDVITANITSNVIISNLRYIRSKLKQHGKLFLSGILKEEKGRLKHEITKGGFIVKQTLDKGEWTSFFAANN